MNRLALELLALVSPTPRPAIDLAAALGVPLGGRGTTLRNLCRLLRRRKLGVQFGSWRSEVLQRLLPEPPRVAVFYVWVDPACWQRVQAVARRQGIACPACGAHHRWRVTHMRLARDGIRRRRQCQACGTIRWTLEMTVPHMARFRDN